MTQPDLAVIADRLTTVDGVVGVCLGGSRARGTHRPDSDYDLGIYYRGRLDVDALADLARTWAGPDAEVTAPGAWGKWVNGGGWLRSGGDQVDWIYRDLDRVERVWAECQEGRYELGQQAGHPLGFYSHAYAGELAVARVLADPSGTLAALQRQTRDYPPALGAALVRAVWEADLVLAQAAKGAAGSDPAYVAGCLFRAVGVACHALHGHDGVWLINEKGMVASAARLPSVPPDFATRVADAFAAAFSSEPTTGIGGVRGLVDEVRAVTRP